MNYLLKSKRAFILFAILVMAASTWIGVTPAAEASGGTTYYISQTFGNDSNDGLSNDTPWKSFANVKNLRLVAGDKVLLRRGDTWNERLTIYGNGAAGNWVYVGPYGNLANPAPVIRLDNSRDSIAIVAQDLIPEAPYNNQMNYIWIDNLTIQNTRIGIYFRYLVSNVNTGVKVTNVKFDNIINEDVLTSMTDLTTVTQELQMVKGNLDKYDNGYSSTGGGAAEYVFPTAILIGGRSGPVNASTPNANKVSEITIHNCLFNNVTNGIAGMFYNIQAGTGTNANMDLTRDWSVQNVTLTGSINGLLAIEAANGGWDGTNQSEWGIFKNLRMLGGHPTLGFPLGLTGGIIESSKNFLIEDSEFSNQTNNGDPDGAGFDFEANTENITIRKSIFANNEGQAILMMDNGKGGHRNVTLHDNLFYNNLQSVTADYIKYDFTVFNHNNTNVNILDNRFVSRTHTAGTHTNVIGKIGPASSGIYHTGSSVLRSNTVPASPTLAQEIINKGLTAATAPTQITQVTNGPD